MPFVQAKCPNCGGILAVDNANDAAVCQFCNTPFIVEKAINNYYTTNNITAETVNIIGGNSADFEIRAGKLIKYHGAATDVVIPNSVTSIAENAFRDCAGLTSVLIPDSVTSIGRSAFSGCTGLTQINYNSRNVTDLEYSSNVFNNAGNTSNGISVVFGDSVQTIPAYLFFVNDSGNKPKITSVTIGNSVTSIAENAFWHCDGLTSVTIPDSVTSIGNSAFSYCTGLTSVTIPDSVTSIGNSAFSFCTGLTSITIPDSVTSIGRSAFFGCKSLMRVTIPDALWMKRKKIFYGSKVKTVVANGSGETWESRGCYVATAVYGSYDCPQVWTLRRFRDQRLALTWYGRLFIALYYAISPTVVKWFGQTAWFNRFLRARLDRMVCRLQQNGYDDTPYSDV